LQKKVLRLKFNIDTSNSPIFASPATQGLGTPGPHEI